MENVSSSPASSPDASLAFAVASWPKRRGRHRSCRAPDGPSTDEEDGAQAPRRARCPRDRRPPPNSGPRPATALAERWDRLDGILQRHRIRPTQLPGERHVRGRLERGVGRPQHLRLLAQALIEPFKPLLVHAGRAGGASVVGLDFDATVAWPIYDWMAWPKAAPGVPHSLSPRVPGTRRHPGQPGGGGTHTHMAAKSIPASRCWRSPGTSAPPLGWDVNDSAVVARACVALFSDLLPMTTGEILHVDGGVHAVR